MSDLGKKGHKTKYPYLWACVYGVLLTGYAMFTLLDAFVIPRDLVYMGETGQGMDAADMGEPDGLTDMEDMESIGNEQTVQEELSLGEGTSPEEILSEGTLPERTPSKGISPERTPSDEIPSGGLQTENSEEGESAPATDPVITDTSYESSSFSITITTIREHDTQIYIADITASDVSCLRAGLAGGAFGRNLRETTSTMAEDNNAILAVNGDYYGFRDSGIVVRNGYLYRDTARSGFDNEILVIYGDGRFEIAYEAEADAAELVENGAQQVFSFGPGLIREGEITVGEDSEVGQAMQSNPRTAIGMVEPLHYILLVSDGRTRESAGLTLYELAAVMQGLGCETAYNLDGGGSSTMWFMGKIINIPTNGWSAGERRVSDIVYIGE